MRYAVVPGATPAAIVCGDIRPWVDAFIAAGRYMVADGCTGLATTYGFLTLLRDEVETACGVPVVSSALDLIPGLLDGTERPGVLTISQASLSATHLAAAGVTEPVPLVGVDGSHFAEAILNNRTALDPAKSEADLVAGAERLCRITPRDGTHCPRMHQYAALSAYNRTGHGPRNRIDPNRARKRPKIRLMRRTRRSSRTGAVHGDNARLSVLQKTSKKSHVLDRFLIQSGKECCQRRRGRRCVRLDHEIRIRRWQPRRKGAGQKAPFDMLPRGHLIADRDPRPTGRRFETERASVENPPRIGFERPLSGRIPKGAPPKGGLVMDQVLFGDIGQGRWAVQMAGNPGAATGKTLFLRKGWNRQWDHPPRPQRIAQSYGPDGGSFMPT